MCAITAKFKLDLTFMSVAWLDPWSPYKVWQENYNPIFHLEEAGGLADGCYFCVFRSVSEKGKGPDRIGDLLEPVKTCDMMRYDQYGT